MSVEELRDLIAKAIRGTPLSGEPPWEHLAESRKEGWRSDANRVLEVLESEQAKEVLRMRAEMRAGFMSALDDAQNAVRVAREAVKWDLPK